MLALRVALDANVAANPDGSESEPPVCGVNTDSVERHRNFAANHRLPICLLSDSKRKMIRDYKMKNLFCTRRGVIVIGTDGVIRFRKVVMLIFRRPQA
jgi:peroxiredoxin